MPSIKQVEAFYWSGQLGSFVAAADRLNTTQSNISKRIQELESTLGVELFDRSKRAIKVTAKGVEVMAISDQLLRVHMNLRQVGNSELALAGPFRFGVTEAVALTWLARFSLDIQNAFAGLVPISTVDTSINLNTLLLERKIDLAIGTERNLDKALVRIRLADAERVWVASPSLIEHDRILTAAEMGELPMLGHGDSSFQNNLVIQHLRDRGINLRIVTSCTSMSALARMAIDGIGITYLHQDVFAAEIAAGRLKVIKTDFEIPPVTYVAAHRDDVISPVAALVAARAVALCDFRSHTTPS
ncbi:LysR family transcriptional regulator [Devosia sp. XGJD_8]|uniref:LysR family transcriptional regulator n=1 Tax=Devosia sp. XGJD_8 TaxID=3391187 RepID=UPI00398535E0